MHISELADHRVKSVGEVVKPGQEVKVRVIEVDEKTRRVSLSIKRANDVVSAAPEASTPAAPKKKRKTELKGGLDWNW